MKGATICWRESERKTCSGRRGGAHGGWKTRLPLFLIVCLCGIGIRDAHSAAMMSADDGVSINIRRSSAGGSTQPPVLRAQRPSAKGMQKGKTTGDNIKIPRPTAETFGDDFSGRGKMGRGASTKHGDGGVTLTHSARGSKPWERKPKAADVKKAEPSVAEKPKDKNMARVRYGKAGVANRHDTSTFSVNSFGDEALKLLPALVANLEHKFGASKMTHVQKGSVPAILQGADVLLRARTGTGKTLAYLVPIAQHLASSPERIPRENGTHALIVVPTREVLSLLALLVPQYKY